MTRKLMVYAAATNVPITICKDARLRGELRTKDETYGQRGWEWGINFAKFHELCLTLTNGKTQTPPHTCGNYYWDCDPPEAGEIAVLALQAHGAPGVVDVNCDSADWYNPSLPAGGGLRKATMGKFSSDMALLNTALAPDGLLYFFSCRAGQGSKGTELLVEVSRRLPGREIVAYTTMGYSSGADQKRPGKQCGEAGMRDTPFLDPAPTTALEDARYSPLWNDLDKMPWAARFTPHAKVVKDGKVIKSGNPAEP